MLSTDWRLGISLGVEVFVDSFILQKKKLTSGKLGLFCLVLKTRPLKTKI